MAEQSIHPLVNAADGDSRSPEDKKALQLVETANLLLRNARFISACVFVFVLAAVIPSLIKGRTYSSGGTFLPQAEGGISGVQAIAAQFGVGGGGGGMSPQFYVDLLHSRQLLQKLVLTPYRFTAKGAPVSTNLVQLLAPGSASDSVARLDKAIEKIALNIRASSSPATDVVSFNVSTDYPELSQAVASRILALVNSFDVESRQSRAAAQRHFTESRLSEARDEAFRAQAAVTAFHETNRLFMTSPTLEQANSRLTMEMRQKEQTYLTLSDAYEKARIDEVRDTPVITIIDSPTIPIKPDPRGLAWRGMLGIVLGLLVGVFFSFIREPWRQAKDDESQEIREFMALTHRMRSDVGGVMRRARRLGRPSKPANN